MVHSRLRYGPQRSGQVWLERELIEVLTVGRSQIAMSHVRVYALAAPEPSMCCPALVTVARNAYGLASDCLRESSTNS